MLWPVTSFSNRHEVQFDFPPKCGGGFSELGEGEVWVFGDWNSAFDV